MPAFPRPLVQFALQQLPAREHDAAARGVDLGDQKLEHAADEGLRVLDARDVDLRHGQNARRPSTSTVSPPVFTPVTRPRTASSAAFAWRIPSSDRRPPPAPRPRTTGSSACTTTNSTVRRGDIQRAILASKLAQVRHGFASAADVEQHGVGADGDDAGKDAMTEL